MRQHVSTLRVRLLACATSVHDGIVCDGPEGRGFTLKAGCKALVHEAPARRAVALSAECPGTFASAQGGEPAFQG